MLLRLAEALDAVVCASRHAAEGRRDFSHLVRAAATVREAVCDLERSADDIAAFWNSDEAKPVVALMNFAAAQADGMETMAERLQTEASGQTWYGRECDAPILDETREGMYDFVAETEALVSAVDEWADKPLGREPSEDRIRFEWPG